MCQVDATLAGWTPDEPQEETMTGAELIAEERQRQIDAEGYDAAHDDKHTDGSIAVHAAALAVFPTDARVLDDRVDAQGQDDWGLVAKHGRNEVRALTIAGALIAAEIDRVQRRGSDA